MKISEKDIEKYLKEQVSRKKGLCMKMEGIPGFAGMPDRLVMLPGGLVAFVEVKAPEGKISSIQKFRIAELKTIGVEVYVAYSEEDVDNILKKMNGWGGT